jgi:hypothetical protein
MLMPVPSPSEVMSWAPIDAGLVVLAAVVVAAVLVAVVVPVEDDEIVVMAGRTADGGAD